MRKARLVRYVVKPGSGLFYVYAILKHRRECIGTYTTKVQARKCVKQMTEDIKAMARWAERKPCSY